MSKEKDKSIIPEGMYCYVPDNEKNDNKDENDEKYYIKRCPYFSYKEDNGVNVVYCSFLEEGGTIEGTSRRDYRKLKKKYGSSKKVQEKYPLYLLWDLVKECGENMGYDEDDENAC